jgi:spore germination protein GerM
VAIVAGLAGLLALVPATAPRWSRFLRQPLATTEEDGVSRPATASPVAVAPQRTIRVKLYFESPEGNGLMLEERDVVFASDLARQIEIVAEELLQGSHEKLLSPLPAETRVLGAFVTRAGVAYLNLSKEAQTGGAGTRSELLSVFSLVDTFATSFPAIKRVQLLIDDRPADTLWGHVDLNRPLVPDLTLLALLESPAAPTPPASAVPVSPAPVVPR